MPAKSLGSKVRCLSVKNRGDSHNLVDPGKAAVYRSLSRRRREGYRAVAATATATATTVGLECQPSREGRENAPEGRRRGPDRDALSGYWWISRWYVNTHESQAARETHWHTVAT